jgi:hypothetical protein
MNNIAISPKAKIEVSEIDGIKVATVTVQGMGGLSIMGNHDYPDVYGNESIVDILLDWAETQPFEKTPSGHLVSKDPVYDIWEALTA